MTNNPSRARTGNECPKCGKEPKVPNCEGACCCCVQDAGVSMFDKCPGCARTLSQCTFGQLPPRPDGIPWAYPW